MGKMTPPPFCKNMTFYKSPSLLTPKCTLPYLYKVSTNFSLLQILVVGGNTLPPSSNQLGMGAFQRFRINIMKNLLVNHSLTTLLKKQSRLH